MNRHTTSKTARHLLIEMACLWILCSFGQTQEKPPAERSAQFLPPGTGEPFTVVPIDMPDVECQVLEWNKKLNAAARPTLTLLCPPEQIFAPLRVLIKLSQLNQDKLSRLYEDKKEASLDPERILIVPGEKTRLRTRKNCAWVHLDVLDANGKPYKGWIPFTGVADVALVPRYPKQSR